VQHSFSQHFRFFGQTSIQVSLLGFGAAVIGNLYQAVPNEAARAAVSSALDLGISYFDAAPYYGFGLSETRLAKALQNGNQTDQVLTSTKAGRLLVLTHSKDGLRHGFTNTPALEPVFDYSYDAVMRSFEVSLIRLGREPLIFFSPMTWASPLTVMNIRFVGGSLWRVVTGLCMCHVRAAK
jgi:D-threo-aldose 1-dehydrogenase